MRSVKQVLEGKSKELISVTPDTPVIDMVRTMAEHTIGAVLVMRNDELIGIATERDYARKIVLMNRSSSDTPVSTIMSSPVITVSPDQRVNMCMQLITEKRIRHLPVVSENRVIGVLSIGDLLKVVIEEQQHEIEQLQHYISS